jgi:thiol-disulfide isomerase/thioredoxin
LVKKSATAKKFAISIFAFVYSVLWLSIPVIAGDDFRYFNDAIDYWNDKKIEPLNKKIESPGSVEGKLKKQNDFDWKKHLDPQNPEFFKEGDHVPPEPFMEIVRNPSDENLKLWFQYIDKKNELMSTLQIRMAQFLEKEGKSLEPIVKESLKKQVQSVSSFSPDAKRYRFRLYFESTCPHCRRMFDTLKTLQDQGFYVEARQIDSHEEGLRDLPISSSRATKEEIQKYKIQSVPFLLIGDLKKKIVFQMTGFQTPESIFDLIQSHGEPKSEER